MYTVINSTPIKTQSIPLSYKIHYRFIGQYSRQNNSPEEWPSLEIKSIDIMRGNEKLLTINEDKLPKKIYDQFVNMQDELYTIELQAIQESRMTLYESSLGIP